MNLSDGHLLAYTVPHGTSHVRPEYLGDNAPAQVLVQSIDATGAPEWGFLVEAHEDGWQEPDPFISLNIPGRAFAVFHQAPELISALTETCDGVALILTLSEVVAVLERFGAKETTADRHRKASGRPWGWLIVLDHASGEGDGTPIISSFGMDCGIFDRLERGEGKRFRLRDGDGNLDYEGRIIVAPEDDGSALLLAPLDWAKEDSGSTSIEYLNEQTGEWQEL
ncbi:hypothetical protein AB0K21_21645 [Streptosporangium sp. NPDC049248]|uniref:hypothetical protein n=1 Tax=Streptosporangium sp. NPDC049248 TaxID=3155651 RepID=UPI0034388247